MKAQESQGFNWGVVIAVIVFVVVLALLIIFVAPKVAPAGVNETGTGFGEWLTNILSVK